MINTGKPQALRLAKQTLELIIENKMGFKLPNDFKETVYSLHGQKEPFTDNQLSFIEGLYEKYFKLGGFQSASVKHDNKRRV